MPCPRIWIVMSIAFWMGAALAEEPFDARMWLDRFAFHPPLAFEGAVAAHESAELPAFTVAAPGAGTHLIRISLPFSPGALSAELGVAVLSQDREFDPDMRVLTHHPGTPRWVRRALVTFPYEFTNDAPVNFRLKRSLARNTSYSDDELRIGTIKLQLTADSVVIEHDDGRSWRADVIAPEISPSSQRQFEIIERGKHYLWARLLVADAVWPRIIEVQADSLGAAALQVHVQRLEKGDGHAPQLGWTVTSPQPIASEQHTFDDGDPLEAHSQDGTMRIRFPIAPLTRRGTVQASGRQLRYLRSSPNDHVPHQEAAWRRAAVVIGPAGHTPRTTLLEPGVYYRVDAVHYDALYGSGTDRDLTPWLELDDLRIHTRNAIIAASLRGDDFGNVTSFNPNGSAGVFGMNRLNHGPPIFEEYYRSGDERLRETAVLWCNNMHDLSIWWGNDTHFGGTRYNNAVAAGRDEHKDDQSFMWRTNTGTSTFCTKGYDAFFYAYEETGDPRMASALRHQAAFAQKHVHADTGEARNIGDAADFARLYRFTGQPAYREHAFRLFRELRTKLGDDHLFSQSGAPIEVDRPFIDDDAFGYHHPFAKPYIIGYALAGCPWLLEWEPAEPALRGMVRAVADFLAESVDPVGGWRYPAPESSNVLISQGIEHAAQLVRAAKALEALDRSDQSDPTDPTDDMEQDTTFARCLDAIERVLQARVQGYLRTGRILGGLTGWERSTGALESGQSLHDRYAKPSDRDRTRDYAEGNVGVGGAPPDGLVYLSEVLDFYLEHRPAERLFNATPELAQVIERIPDTPPRPANRPAPSFDSASYGVKDRLPSFNAIRIREMDFPLAWVQSELDFETWRAKARARLFKTLGTPPPRGRFDPVVLAEEDRETHTAYAMAFNVNAWSRVKGYLLVPKGEGPFPAVLALHDHGAHFSIGKEKVVRPFGVTEEHFADAQSWVDRYYGGQWIGDALAARGYVVFATDALFWGDRGRAEGIKFDEQQALGANMLHLGMSWAGTILWDDLRSAEFLQSRPEVDPARIGAIGLSMGAYRTWNLAAASDIIRAGAAICWMGDTKALAAPGNNQTAGQSAFSMLQPYIRNDLDYPDVASIACPKPMLFFNGAEDGLFPNDGVRRSFQKMNEVWTSQGARPNLVTELWPGVPHEFNAAMQVKAFAFLDAHLEIQR